jgi:hypothetical protein
MIHTGLLPHLLNQIRRSLKKDAQIPWSAFIETLSRLDAKLQPMEVDAIFEGVANSPEVFQTDLMMDLVESTGLDSYDPRPPNSAAEELKPRCEITKIDALI